MNEVNSLRDINSFEDLVDNILRNNEFLGNFDKNTISNFLQDKEKNENLENIFNEKEIKIDNANFKYFKEENFDHSKIFLKFQKIRFENCSFEILEIGNKNLENDKIKKIVNFINFNFDNIKKRLFLNNCIIISKFILVNKYINYIISIYNSIFKNIVYCEEKIFQNIISFKNSVFENQIQFGKSTFQEKAYFDESTFKELAYFGKSKFKNGAYFENSIFENRAYFADSYFENYIIFSKSIFKNETNFSDSIFTNQVHFINSTFKEEFKCEESNFAILVSFYNAKFENLTSFKKTKFNQANFKKVNFIDIVVFSEIIFNNKIDFEYTKFLNKSIFKNTIFKKELNLRNTIFKYEADFIDITSEKASNKPLKVANRETARIIKDNFEKANNIIEANRYYTLEMSEREKELEKDKKNDFLDYLVFKIHKISSNHSQNWLLSIYWIIAITLFYSTCKNLFLNSAKIKIFDATSENFILQIYKIQNDIFDEKLLVITLIFTSLTLIIILNWQNKVKNIRLPCYNFCFFLCFLITYLMTSNNPFEDFSTNLNPFSIMNDNDKIDILTLIYKIIIAYLIYQFIISIRQNTRRK